ncbi:unnamed protein product [Spirodela intermedia]|uniref:Uncharacterized protein n=1 Tax=Spirodela intermedia TaxID=51605 RepID=A0A7I8J6J5_SPIIN|nr:unnamed protein product [Spirodela intermedia]CAA6665062.1 unnamed protein product [Spirodela intermedia]
MAYHQKYDMEYVPADFFNMSEFEYDNSFEDDPPADDDYGNDDAKPNTDTSALEFRNGKDIQGILWDRMNCTRDICRETRLKQYKNYESVLHSRAELEKECSPVEKNSIFYRFNFNTRAVKSTIMHFQLRNLVWATSKHDVYLMRNYSVIHWSAVLRRGKEVLNVAGQVSPSPPSTRNRRGPTGQPLSRVQISTMAVKDELMAIGGFQGELVCKRLDRPGVAFCSNLTTDENAITNAVDIYSSPSGSTRLMTANNDCQVRIFDVDDFSLLTKLSFPWSVNSASVSPDGKLAAVLGDTVDCLLADPQSGKVLHRLKGHLDYSFSSAWHPDGRVVVTGSQDTTCRVWDVRNPSRAMAVLRGRMGAIRGIKFTAEGRFMAAAEAVDFVHVFDCGAGPDTEALFVGVADRTYGSLLEFRRTRPNHYLDSLF